MRKNKGYQKDIRKTWHQRQPINSNAKGENMTLEQYIDKINEEFDLRIKACKKQYDKLSTKTTLEGKDLYKYCSDWMFWEVRFDVDYDKDKYTVIPLEKALEMIEEDRRKTIGRHLYHWNGYQKRIVNKDNQKFVYNSGNGWDGYRGTIARVPSMKRSKATWKRFYELFPYYKENYNKYNNKNGLKLKKVW